jgi:hypothetical protein
VAHIAASILPRYAILCPSFLETAFEFLSALSNWTPSDAPDGESKDAATAVKVAESAYGGLVELLAGLAAGVRDGSLTPEKVSSVSEKVAVFLIEKQGDAMLPQPRSAYPPDEENEGSSFLPSFSPSDPYGFLRRAAGAFRNGQSTAATSARLVAGALASGFILDPCTFLKAALGAFQGSELDCDAAVHFFESILTTDFPEEPADSELAENGEPEEGEVGVNEPESLANGDEGSAESKSSWIAAVLHPRPEAEQWLIQAVRQSKAAAGDQWPLLERVVEALKSADASSLGGITEEEAQAGVPEFYSRVAAGKGERAVELDIAPPQPETGAIVEFPLGESAAKGPDTMKAELGPQAKLAKDTLGAGAVPPGGETGADAGDKSARERTPEHGRRPRRERSSSRESQDGWANRRGRNRSQWDEKSERPPKRRRFSSSDSEGNRHRERSRSPGRRTEGDPSVRRMGVGNVAQASWFVEGDPKAYDVFPASRHLWVGSLVKGITDEVLRQQFEQYGRVEKATAIWNKHHGFIDFFKVQDAVRAREALQGEQVWGHQRLALRFSDGGRKKSPDKGGGGSLAIWVGGINSQSAKEDLLHDLKAGGVVDARSVTVLLTASALLLEYDAPEDATAAVVHIRMRRAAAAGKGV